MNQKKTGILLDIDYQYGEESIIRMVFSNSGKKTVCFDPKYKPYLYFLPAIEATEAKNKLLHNEYFKEKIVKIEIEEKKKSIEKGEEEVLKVFFKSTGDLAGSRQELEQLDDCLSLREQDIPFHKRYLLDNLIEPTAGYEYEIDKNENLISIKKLNEKEETALKKKTVLGSFDLETLSSKGFSNAEFDPIAMAAYSDSKNDYVVSYKKIKKCDILPPLKWWASNKWEDVAFLPTKRSRPLPPLKRGGFFGLCETVKDEKELIIKLKNSLKETDIICTYNGDKFDFPYIIRRSEKTGTDFKIGALDTTPKTERKGMENAAQVFGSAHVDVFRVIKTMARFGAIDLIRYDLESVVKAVFGNEKEKVKANEINDAWNNNKGLERVANYNLEDTQFTRKLCEIYLPLFEQFSRLVKYSLFDSSRAGSGQLVESLLFAESMKRNILFPARPSQSEINMRLMQSYAGGYVKEPTPGLHENIAVLDFTSLHPTIMISHNISPETVDCKHKECKEKNMAPSKNHFCQKEKGFFSTILENLFTERKKWKTKLKTLKKGTIEYTQVYARQQALKILLNSFYGALGYARFRWYSRESARAITAWSKEYVMKVSDRAEKDGFTSLYSDTDSAFLKIPEGKTHKDVEEFLKKVNKSLPGVMNLELQGFYKRGIFVTKKSGEKAAKKRYALIDEKGNLKIVGFEYVRRDWSSIAKNTQRDVLKAVLEEGKPEKAVQIVKNNLQLLKGGKALNKDLIVYTQIRRNLDKYAAIGPHVAAARKANKKGQTIGEGSIIGYIITKNGKSISEKAELEEYVKEGNYDSDYYIKNQLIPAVIKIISEFGYTEQDLLLGGKQTGLGAFE